MDMDSRDTEVDSLNYRYALNIENGFAYIGQQKAASNVKGMIAVGYTFNPNVTYQTIGSAQDKTSSTIIYAVWASDGNHCILRYFKNDPSSPNGAIYNVITYDFGWTSTTKIHSSEVITTTIDGVLTTLWYWTDNVCLRKINVTKATLANKFKSWDVYAYKSYTVQGFGLSTLIEVKNLQGTVIGSVTVMIPVGPSLQQVYAEMATQINASPMGLYITGSACSDHLHITENDVNSYTIVIYPSLFKVVPSNFYGYELIDRFFDLAKWPGNQQPNPVYAQDPMTQVNRVSQIPFQFAIQLFYDDFEDSVLSQISPIAVTNIDSGLYERDSYNYIQVLFNNEYLNDPNSWVLVKRAALMVRQHNDGVWNQVYSDKIYNFYDEFNGTATLGYNFYNNETLVAISTQLSTQQYDLVPITANTLKYVKNTLVTGGIQAGRSAVECPDMNIQVTGTKDPQQPLRKISGSIRIFTPAMRRNNNYNLFVPGPNNWTCSGQAVGALYREPTIFDTDRGCELNGIICHNSTMITPPATTAAQNPAPYPQTPFSWYGGVGFRPDQNQIPTQNQVMDVQVQVYNEYDQRLPEGGWAPYLAGTPYFAISRQNNIGLETAGDGSIELSSVGTVNASSLSGNSAVINADATVLSTLAQRFSSGNNNNVGSTFEIEAPPGIYIVRLPSNWCSWGDKLSKGPAYDLYGNSWQKTSSPIWGCLDSNDNWLPGQQEFIVDCRYGDVDAGTFVVLDACPAPGYNFTSPNFAQPWTNYFGYLYDDNGRLDARSSTWSGVPVELAGVSIFNTGTSYTQIGQVIPSFNQTCQGFTDHNGFFFMVGEYYNGSNAVLNGQNVLGFDARGVANTTYRSISSPAYQGNLNDIIEKTFNILPLTPTANKLYNVILTTDNQNARLDCMTFAEGTILDQASLPCGGVNIAVPQGAVEYTDQSGEYALRIWGNTKQYITGVKFNSPYSRCTFGAGNNYGNATRIADSYQPSIVFYQNPVGTVQGRIVPTLAMCSLSQFAFSALPTYPPYNLTQFAANPNTQSNTPPYSPTSIWSLGTAVINRGDYYVSKGKKSGGKYIYAIRYQDQQARQCSVITQPSLTVQLPFETEDWNKYFPNQYPAGTYLQGIPSLVMNINHQPPTWADTYTILRTKEQNFGSYLDWIINDVEYVIRQAGDGTATDIVTSYENKDATHIRMNIANLANYQAQFSNSRLGYTWTSGDRLRFKWDRSLNYFEGLLDYQITLYEGPGYIYIPFLQDIPQVFSGTGIEIYTPASMTSASDQIYYECGISFPCTNPGQSNNAHSVTSFVLSDGDCYWRPRSIPVYDTNFDYVQDYPTIIQDPAISDFYQSTDQDIGRLGVVDPYFVQQFFPTNLRPSETFIYNTEANGLSSFPPLNDVVLDPSYGAIQKLEASGLTLIVECANKIDAYYLGATLGTGQDGTGLLIIGNSLFGNERPLEPSYGCSNPEGSASYDNKGYKYGCDLSRGVVWRYASNGLEEISQYKMRSFFDQFKHIPIWSAPGAFDTMKRKYILTIYPKITQQLYAYGGVVGTQIVVEPIPGAQIGDIVIVTGTLSNGEVVSINGTVTVVSNTTHIDLHGKYTFNLAISNQKVEVQYKGIGQTVAFDEDKNGWSTFYSFTQDNYNSVDDQLVSFKNGALYLHDQDSVNYNNFAGVKYPSQISMIFNVEKSEIKTWWSLLLDQVQDDGGNDWFVPEVTTPYPLNSPSGQLSNVPNSGFEKMFQFWHAFFLRDQNTPNVTYPDIEGDLLQSNAIQVTLQNPSNVHFNLLEARVNFTTPKLTTK